MLPHWKLNIKCFYPSLTSVQNHMIYTVIHIKTAFLMQYRSYISKFRVLCPHWDRVLKLLVITTVGVKLCELLSSSILKLFCRDSGCFIQLEFRNGILTNGKWYIFISDNRGRYAKVFISEGIFLIHIATAKFSIAIFFYT